MELKPALTIDEQLKVLRSRGLIIDNIEESRSFLQSNQYYRLNIYFHKFMDLDNHFKSHTNFRQIMWCYLNDRWLRNKILLLLEEIEIKAKTQIAYYLGINYGSNAFYISELYKVAAYQDQIIKAFNLEKLRNKKDPVILHHIQKYSGKFPIWVILEYLTFNSISKYFSNLQEKDKKIIAKEGFGLHETLYENWLHVLSVLRNICAHYGYLYRREYTVRPKIAREFGWDEKRNNELFALILIMRRLCEEKSWERFSNELENRTKKIESFNLLDYGFPGDWKLFLDKTFKNSK